MYANRFVNEFVTLIKSDVSDGNCVSAQMLCTCVLNISLKMTKIS